MRKPFVPVALIAGAMAPDIPYFLKIPVTAQSWYEPFVNATFSHSFKGLLLVGLPGVVMVVLLYHLLKRPIGALVPCTFNIEGSTNSQRPNWYSFGIWFLISALIGLTTHYVWDSLTFRGGLLIANLPFLPADAVGSDTANRVLQHASTLLGAIVIVIWCVQRFRSGELSIKWIAVSRAGAIRRLTIVMTILLTSALLAAFSVVEVRDRDGALGLELTLSLFIKSGVRIAVIAIAIYALIWYIVSLSKKFSAQGTNAG